MVAGRFFTAERISHQKEHDGKRPRNNNSDHHTIDEIRLVMARQMGDS